MKKMILAIASLSLLASGVQAADMSNTDGVYVGISHNSRSLGADETFTYGEGGLYAGYRVGNLGGEIAYSEKKIDSETFTFVDVSFVPRMNLTKNFDLIGKVGARHSTYKYSGSTWSGTALVIGVGAEYAFTNNWSIRGLVDYSTKPFGLTTTTGTNKLVTTTLGVAYKF